MSGQAVDGLHDGLPQRGMGVDVAGHLVDRQVPLLGEGQFGQQFGDVRADQVRTEELAVLRVAQQLDEAAGIPDAGGLSVGAEREGGAL